MEVLEVTLDFIMYIIRLRLTVPLSRTMEWMTRRRVWCWLLSDDFGVVAKAEELDRTLTVTVEAILSKEAVDRRSLDRKREKENKSSYDNRIMVRLCRLSIIQVVVI